MATMRDIKRRKESVLKHRPDYKGCEACCYSNAAEG